MVAGDGLRSIETQLPIGLSNDAPEMLDMPVEAQPIIRPMTRLVGTGPALGTAANPITTKRLRIDLPTEEAAHSLFAMTYGPGGQSVTSKLLWNGPIDLNEVAAWCQKYGSNEFNDGGHHWVISQRDDFTRSRPVVMGAIGLTPGDQAGLASLGYWSGEAFWNQGFMTEAVGAVVSHGFDVLNLARIEACTFLTNPASAAVLKKAGFGSEGVRRESAYKYGEWIDQTVWAALRTDQET